MISVEDALIKIIHNLVSTNLEYLSLDLCLDRILGEDIKSSFDNPISPISAMDGYAIHLNGTESLPLNFHVIGEIAAGQSFDRILLPGEAVRIFTGGHLPLGANSIIIQENVIFNNNSIRVQQGSLKIGQHVRQQGIDFKENQILVSKGVKLTSRHLALLAAAGYNQLPIKCKPYIGILCTGNEIVLPGLPKTKEQIYSSNHISLAHLVSIFGGIPIQLGIVEDNEKQIISRLIHIEKLDMLVVSGGMSVGAYDLTKSAFKQNGFDLDFWKIAMRPGKPLMFGHYKNIPVLGLPGNPVSTFIGAFIFLKKAIYTLLGQTTPLCHTILQAYLVGNLPANDQRQDYLRAHMKILKNLEKPGLWVEPFILQDSSVLSNLAEANALIVRTPFAPALTHGSIVETLIIENHGF
ncbi:MAG: molybdopterin molybdotransferase MoeA [Alphaproteobacteria bacterium]|nr:molybdopterin molybdotransferase MoeA [Alphaproteobacteria bacterium]